MRYNNLILPFLIIGFSIMSTSCNKDDEAYSSGNTGGNNTSKVSQPVFDKNLTTTTTSDVSFRCRFTNGGDTWENMNCVVHWRQYSSKPSTTPKTSDMTKHEQMRQYATTSTKTTFDKTHTGFSGGTYVYYYFECKNSKFVTKKNITYCIVKR